MKICVVDFIVFDGYIYKKINIVTFRICRLYQQYGVVFRAAGRSKARR